MPPPDQHPQWRIKHCPRCGSKLPANWARVPHIAEEDADRDNLTSASVNYFFFVTLIVSAGSPFIGSVSLFEVQLKIREAHLPNMGHARAAQHASPADTPRPQFNSDIFLSQKLK